jgi:hypothetical protein
MLVSRTMRRGRCLKMDFSYIYELVSNLMKVRFTVKSACTIPVKGLLCLACLLLGASSQAAEPLTGTMKTMNPRALGLSGAMVASPASTSAIYFNPATIVMTPLYHIEGMYQYAVREKMHMGGVAIVDSVTTVVGAGLSFNYSGIDQTRTEYKSYDVRLALSGAIGKIFFLGATGRYLRLEQNLNANKWGPVGTPALPASGSQQVDGFTFDAGAALKLGEILSLGIAGCNLTNTESVFAPIELIGGISLSPLEMLLLELDVESDFTSHDDPAVVIRFGGELFLAGSVAIRGGYSHDFFFNINGISAGLGYVHSRFALDAGFTQEIRENGRIAFALGIKFFVN